MGFLRTFTGARDNSGARALVSVYVNIFCYALCYWMTMPVMPFLSSSLGADAVLFGWLQTTFSAFQLVGGPLIGRICDTKGARRAVLLSQAGAAASYLLLGGSHSLPVLFVSRLPTLLMHTMHAAQALCTDLSTDTARATALGRLSLAYGVGMVAGAPLGGLLSAHLGYHGVALLAGCLSLMMLPLSLLTLPEGRAAFVAKENEAQKAEATRGWWRSLAPMFDLLKQRAPRRMLVFKLTLGVGLSMQNSMQSMILRDKFGLTAQSMGVTQSIGGVVAVATNTLLVGWLLAAFTEAQVLVGAVLVIMTSLLAMAWITSFQTLLLLYVPLVAASAVIYTVTTAAMTQTVAAQHTGTAIGLDHASRSACGMVGPVLGGLLFRAYGAEAIHMFAAAAAGVAVLHYQLSGAAATHEKKKAQ